MQTTLGYRLSIPDLKINNAQMGPQGPQGATGTQGTQGATGTQGSGNIVDVDNSTATTYNINAGLNRFTQKNITINFPSSVGLPNGTMFYLRYTGATNTGDSTVSYGKINGSDTINFLPPHTPYEHTGTNPIHNNVASALFIHDSSVFYQIFDTRFTSTGAPS